MSRLPVPVRMSWADLADAEDGVHQASEAQESKAWDTSRKESKNTRTRPSRRAHMRALMGPRLAQEARRKAYLTWVATTLFPVCIAWAFCRKLRHHMEQTRRIRRLRSLHLACVRRRALRRWIKHFRCVQYWHHVHDFSTFFWMDGNCATHLAQLIAKNVAKKLSSQRHKPGFTAGEAVRNVTYVVGQMERLVDFPPYFFDHERDTGYRGQITRALRHIEAARDELQRLNMRKVFQRHLRDSRLDRQVQILEVCFKQRAECWRMLVRLSLKASQIPELMQLVPRSARTADMLLKTAIATVDAAPPIDSPVAKTWAKSRHVNVLLGMSAVSLVHRISANEKGEPEFQ